MSDSPAMEIYRNFIQSANTYLQGSPEENAFIGRRIINKRVKEQYGTVSNYLGKRPRKTCNGELPCGYDGENCFTIRNVSRYKQSVMDDGTANCECKKQLKGGYKCVKRTGDALSQYTKAVKLGRLQKRAERDPGEADTDEERDV